MILNIFYAWLQSNKINFGGNLNSQKEISDKSTETYRATIKYSRPYHYKLISHTKILI